MIADDQREDEMLKDVERMKTINKTFSRAEHQTNEVHAICFLVCFCLMNIFFPDFAMCDLQVLSSGSFIKM